MRLRAALGAIPENARRPALWGGALAWVFLQIVGRHLSAPPVQAGDPVAALLSGFAHAMDPVAYLLLAPFAWQWTGDDRTMAPWTRAVPLGILLALASAAILKLPWVYGISQRQGLPFTFRHPDLLHGSMALFVLISLFAGYGIVWSEDLDSQRRQAIANLREAKWTLLRSQLSPHLVLNALNGLAGLVEEDPRRAARGLEDLAEIYEQISDIGEMESVPLIRERRLLERYLAVEQLRLEENLRIHWDWDHHLDTLDVPPLLLQPLVENALKYGISPHPGGGELRIHCRRMGAHLHLEVSNTGCGLDSQAAASGSGVGLRNLRRRLELAFGDLSALDLRQDGEWTRAILILPAAPL